MKEKELLILFAKNTAPGYSKSRLAQTVGHQAASRVYQELIVRIQEEMLHLSQEKVVFFADRIEPDEYWPSEVYHKKLQTGDDLGERMSNAFKWGFSKRFQRVILIGTDIYNLNKQDLVEAFSALESQDAVLGPARDGGYYLIGMTRNFPELFKGIPWSTSRVCEQTIQAINSLSLSFKLLPPKLDIDREDDIQKMDPMDQELFKRIIHKR